MISRKDPGFYSLLLYYGALSCAAEDFCLKRHDPCPNGYAGYVPGTDLILNAMFHVRNGSASERIYV
ncbi:MAG TPA: hypothetical protein H9711_02200 [Candidatus Mediterraneibacter intestinavium]|nr:hypothetical protein [Candidatus Mediterraneibacter intestinavium]